LGEISTLVNPNWTIPPGNCNAAPPELGPGWSLFALAFPYLEQQVLANALNFSLIIAEPSNATVRGTKVSVYVCQATQAFPWDCSLAHGRPPSVRKSAKL
jgi:hypothetical protein